MKPQEIRIRITPEDKMMIEKAAKESGLNTAVWVRMIAIKEAKNVTAK